MATLLLSLPFLPVLHGYSDGPFLLAWDFDPFITAGLLGALLLYGYGWHRLRESGRLDFPGWYAWSFTGGIIATAIALLGPPEAYNEQLFLLHMTQHLILIQVSAPLLLLGRPVQLALKALPPRYSRSTVRTLFGKQWRRVAITLLTGPVVAFMLFNINLGFWHLPAFYNAALRSELVHHLEHGLFFGTALAFWWIIIEPIPRHHKISPLFALSTVFFSMLVGSIIGAAQTFSSTVLYDYYLEAQTPWGLDTLVDQQIGGLIMWVLSGFLYFAVMFVFVVQLMRQDRDRSEADLAAMHLNNDEEYEDSEHDQPAPAVR